MFVAASGREGRRRRRIRTVCRILFLSGSAEEVPTLRALVLVLLLSVLALPAFATTYYLDGRNGDDARDGKTPATAWKSLQIMALNGSHHNIITDNQLYATKRDWAGAGVNVPRGTDSSVIEGNCIHDLG